MPDLPHPSRTEIEAKQLEQLRSLVAELFPGNRFYAQKLNAAGITFDIANLHDFCARFPFTTKSELTQDHSHFVGFSSSPNFGLSSNIFQIATNFPAGAIISLASSKDSEVWASKGVGSQQK